jgi:energy-coupling factor transporter transmembrane protein EcfT
VSALVVGSLDRASEVAATLELRGFALAAKPAAPDDIGG